MFYKIQLCFQDYIKEYGKPMTKKVYHRCIICGAAFLQIAKTITRHLQLHGINLQNYYDQVGHIHHLNVKVVWKHAIRIPNVFIFSVCDWGRDSEVWVSRSHRRSRFPPIDSSEESSCPDVEGDPDEQVLKQVALPDLLLEPVQGNVRNVRTDILNFGNSSQTRQVSFDEKS